MKIVNLPLQSVLNLLNSYLTEGYSHIDIDCTNTISQPNRIQIIPGHGTTITPSPGIEPSTPNNSQSTTEYNRKTTKNHIDDLTDLSI